MSETKPSLKQVLDWVHKSHMNGSMADSYWSESQIDKKKLIKNIKAYFRKLEKDKQ